MRQYTGSTICDGIAIAPAFRLTTQQENVTTELSVVHMPLSFAEENQRFEQACAQVSEFLRLTQQRIAREVGEDEADIFAGQRLLLEDPSFRGTFRQHLQQELTAEMALQETLTAYKAQFRALRQPLFRQRIFDLEDVWSHVLAYLVTGSGYQPVALSQPVILVGEELLPSQLAHLDWNQIQGIITEQGGPSSHTAILARSMKLPYIYDVHEQYDINDQELVILDGYQGLVYAQPTAEMLQSYREVLAHQTPTPTTLTASMTRTVTTQEPTGTTEVREETRLHIVSSEAKPRRSAQTALWARATAAHVTQCGEHITLRANVSMLQDITDTLAAHAEGVGLLRTELLYANRPQFPNETEQYQLYRSILQQMSPHPTTFRTFDLGGDKTMKSFPASPASLSPLGWRGLRIQLDRWDLLRPQLRALLRASPAGSLRVMFPMLSSYEELLHLKERMAEVQQEVATQGHPIADDVLWGLMLETPAAAMQADQLARHVDFLSIGTNDLLQFLMAAERGNSRVSHLLQPTQPALLRLLQMIVQATSAQKCSVSVCGEMAAQPLYLPLLLGLGFRELSAPPKQLPLLQQCLPHITISDAETLVQRSLQTATSAEIFAMALDFAYATGIVSTQ